MGTISVKRQAGKKVGIVGGKDKMYYKGLWGGGLSPQPRSDERGWMAGVKKMTDFGRFAPKNEKQMKKKKKKNMKAFGS